MIYTWALEEEVPSSFPSRTNLGNELFKLVLVLDVLGSASDTAALVLVIQGISLWDPVRSKWGPIFIYYLCSFMTLQGNQTDTYAEPNSLDSKNLMWLNLPPDSCTSAAPSLFSRTCFFRASSLSRCCFRYSWRTRTSSSLT